jgi:fatty-acyl-CoA synthase
MPAPLLDASRAQDIAWLAYTGGTTGRSKGVMIPHRALTTMTLL